MWKYEFTITDTENKDIIAITWIAREAIYDQMQLEQEPLHPGNIKLHLEKMENLVIPVGKRYHFLAIKE
jgi:hypothetical protein